MNRDIIYKELSYQLIGFGYQVFNSLGYGLEEKTYSKIFEQLLIENKIPYSKENYCAIKVNETIVSRNFFDFLVDDTIVIELKVRDRDYKDVCNQLYRYLKASNLKLGIIIRFMRDGVKVKRIVNLY